MGDHLIVAVFAGRPKTSGLTGYFDANAVLGRTGGDVKLSRRRVIAAHGK